MLKSDQVLDPVIACSDYRYKKKKNLQNTNTILFPRNTQQARLMFVCQQEVFSGGNISFGTGSVARFGLCERSQMDRAEH